MHNVQSKDPAKDQEVRRLLVALLTNQVRQVLSFRSEWESSFLRITRFLVWQAVAALRTGAWRTAVAACNSSLALDARNLKGRARRAEAFKALGELDAAALDLRWILDYKPDEADHDPALLRIAQREARRTLADISIMREKEKETAKRMMADGAFWDKSAEQAQTTARPGKDPSQVTSWSGTDVAESPEGQSQTTVKKPVKLILEEFDALEIQKELKSMYARKEVQATLIEMRKAAEYDESRFVRRLRPYLINLLEPLLTKHSLGSGEAGYKLLERALAQHFSTCPMAKANAKELLGVLMGDLVDI